MRHNNDRACHLYYGTGQPRNRRPMAVRRGRRDRGAQDRLMLTAAAGPRNDNEALFSFQQRLQSIPRSPLSHVHL